MFSDPTVARKIRETFPPNYSGKLPSAHSRKDKAILDGASLVVAFLVLGGLGAYALFALLLECLRAISS